MVKKILGWLIFVLIAVFIGFVIWLFFFRSEPVPSNFTPTGRGSDFFPVDTGTFDREPSGDVFGSPTERRGRDFIPRLRQLSEVPTAGAIAFERLLGTSQTVVTESGVEESTNSSITVFRYIERATGHLYETREDTLTQTRLSNTTVPKVYEALFDTSGDRALLRLLDDDGETIETLAAAVTPKSTTSPATFELVADGYSLEGTFLSPNVVSADVSNGGLTYTVPNQEGGINLITADFNDLAKRVVFESPLQEWLIDRVNGNSISLTSKADSRTPGFSYLINRNTGSSEKLIGDINGLTTLISPDEKWLIYALSRGNELDLFAQNLLTGETNNLGLSTLPEKCVFENTNTDIIFCGAPAQAERVPYPQSWYQGLVSFNDNLWRIDLTKDTFDQVLGDREEVNESFDITKLVISPNNQYVLFINKKDQTLWSLDVTVVER